MRSPRSNILLLIVTLPLIILLLTGDVFGESARELPVPSGATLAPHEYLPVPSRSLSFEPWNGGLSNRRLSIEIAGYFACLLNRTLIIPPFLHNLYNYHTYKNKDVHLQYDEILDLDALNTHIPVITYADFLKRGGIETISRRDGYPTVAEVVREDLSKRRPLEPVHWCRSETIGVVPYVCQTMMQLLVRSGYQFDNVNKEKEGHRHWGDVKYFDSGTFDGKKRNLPFESNYTNLHFPTSMLGVYYDKIQLSNAFSPLVSQCKRKMIEGYKFTPTVRTHAAKIVLELGGRDGFSGVHLRRRDFKGAYKSAVHDPMTVLQRFAALFNVDEKVVLFTDDEDEVFDLIRQNLTRTNFSWFSPRLQRMNELKSEQEMRREVRPSLWPLVTQLVMAETRTFVANPLSTFSAYPVRLRYYRGATGPTAYTTSQLSKKPDGSISISRPTLPPWTAENPTGWQP